jgi:hypothetical protein
VHLGGRQRIKKTYKDFVSILIERGKSDCLKCHGLMGDFKKANDRA